MLEEKSSIIQYGTSIVISLPAEIFKDSAFPFKLIEKEGKIEKFDINIIIDKDKKRLIIEKGE